MWWMIAAKVAGNLIGNDRARKAQREQAEAQEKMIKAKNDATIVATAKEIGEINRQRTITNIQTAQALLHYQKQGIAASAQAAMQVAASGVKGSASKAMESEIQRQKDEAEAQEWFNLETLHENFNGQVNSLVNSSKNQFQDMGFIADGWKALANKEAEAFIDLAMDVGGSMMGGGAAPKGDLPTKTPNSGALFQRDLAGAGYTMQSKKPAFKWTT